MKYIAFIFLIISSLGLLAQPGGTDYRGMAVHYFIQEDFEKASMYYLKLWEDTRSDHDFEKYYICQLELKNYKEAERIIKKELKKKEVSLKTYLLYADLYGKQGLEAKMNQQYDIAIKNIEETHTFSQIKALANEFQIRENITRAIETYEQAKKVYAKAKLVYVSPVAFNLQIGELYGAIGKKELMIKEYLSMLEENEAYYAQVQSTLSRSIDFKREEKETNILKTELIRLTQKYPKKVMYIELLIWLFEQKGEFGAAFVQVKALDKKTKANGADVFDFGKTCDNSDEFDMAIKAFQYIIKLGSGSPYYRSANYRLLNTLKRKITESPNYTREDLLTLEEKYKYTLNDVGRAPHSINLMKDLAHLQGFYLQKFDESV